MWIKTVRLFLFRRESRRESMSLPSRSEKCFSGGEVTFNDEVYITNIRHKTALQEALSSLHLVEQSIADGMPEDFTD